MVKNIEYAVKPASIHEKSTVERLLQAYLTELSQFPDENPDYKDAQGIAQYPYLNAYWQEDCRYPYLLYAGNELAGFALVRKGSDFYEIAEFYVLPPFRRVGLGTTCAGDVIRRYPGRWRIGFNRHNQPGRQLWKKVASRLASGDVEEGEADASHDYIRFSSSY